MLELEKALEEFPEAIKPTLLTKFKNENGPDWKLKLNGNLNGKITIGGKKFYFECREIITSKPELTALGGELRETNGLPLPNEEESYVLIYAMDNWAMISKRTKPPPIYYCECQQLSK